MSGDGSFDAAFRAAFEERYAALFRYLDRLSGDPALAADIAQDAFIKLYRRGAMPENVGAWLVSVASNSFRDERRKTSRRLRLLARRAPDATLADAAPAPDANLASEERRRTARAALDQMSERDRQLLLLRHEGYSYHELAAVLDMHESSVGTLLRRATAAFREAVAGGQRASE